MSKSSVRRNVGFKILHFIVTVTCLGGFLYQTTEFLFLYWTYPTVVDIQTYSPSYLEMPSFTFCNPLGYNYDSLCKDFGFACMTPILKRFSGKYICKQFPQLCFDGKLPKTFTPISFTKFMEEISIQPHQHDNLRIRLEEYMTCSIEFNGMSKPCNLENVIGSFYGRDDLPQYCYSIYSLWGNRSKKREVIQKGAIMKFHLFLNASRNIVYDKHNILPPRYNIPSSPVVQIAVHSPYFLHSPYIDGVQYLSGRTYEMRITMAERKLLPAPYQTNCTDYMKIWKERGGKAPINQLGVIQECRLNRTHEALGCIPVLLDYPHNYSICRSCSMKCDYNVSDGDCTLLANSYNQPCDSISYDTTSELRTMYLFEEIDANSSEINIEDGRIKILEHDCSGQNFWSLECSTVDIEVLFDRFFSVKTTYVPKFESLELFSVIGGYLGMWLGVSLLTVYDLLGTLIAFLRAWRRERRKKQKLLIKTRKALSVNSKESISAGDLHYNWQN